MREQLINFETAKLAKEKEFNEYSNYFYTEENGLCIIDQDGEVLSILDDNGCIIENHYNCNGDFWYKELDNDEIEHYEPVKYLAPTQSLLQKWLREVHKLEVHVSFNPDWDFRPINKEKYKDIHYTMIPESEIECLTINKGYRVDWGFVGVWKSYSKEAYPFERTKIKTYEEALEIGLQKSLKLI